MRRLLFLIVAFIAYGSLYPWRFHFSPGVNPFSVVLHSWPVEWGRGELRDAVENVLLYFPLGAAAVLAATKRRASNLAIATAGGFALSTAIELTQVWVPGRDPSLDDILFNTLGTAIGAITALALAPWLRRVQVGREASAGILLLGCWIGSQFFPFLPALKLYRLQREYLALIHTRSLSLLDTWTNAAEWLAACLALELILGRRHARWAALAVGLLALRIFTPGHPVQAEEIVGAAAAALLWLIVPEALRRRAALALMISAVALRELAPFHFSAEPAPFAWIPFRASYEAEIEPRVIVILRKAFDYGALVWLLSTWRGLGYKRAAAISACALLVCELAQRYLPGRTPEITDPVLAILMAIALWVAETL
ncbi:MAG TPA: VanZ family protein [Bryobacteraceae bacterium]